MIINKSYLIILVLIIGITIPLAYSISGRTIISSIAPQLILNGTGDINSGALLEFMGDGNITPNKYIRSHMGELQFLNQKYLLSGSIKDSGIATFNAVVQNNAVTNGSSFPVSTSSNTMVSTGFGVRMLGQYLCQPCASGVDIHGVVYIKNNLTNSGYRIALYRSYIGIPVNGQSPYPNDYQLTSTPPILQTTPNYNSIYLEFTDVGTNIGNQYYYFAYQVVTGGSVTMNNYGAHITASVT